MHFSPLSPSLPSLPIPPSSTILTKRAAQGTGLSTVAAPVGGLVEPLVGGLFKAPENFAHATDAIDDVDQHNEEMERPIGGEEQTGKNPLGLHEGGKGA